MKTRLSAILFSIIITVSAWGQQTDQKAKEIFEKVDQRRSAVTYEQAEMQMVIYDNRGNTRNRSLQSYHFNEDKTSKSLLIFKEPANIRGTAFLTLSEGNNDLQKLYLPALRRIQTISASEKSDRFMGSDFTYEDLGDQDPDDYSFSLKAETDSAFVLSASKKGSSQYDHLIFYVHPQKYALMQIEYFNSDGKMIKKLVAENLQLSNQQLWQPRKMTMYDLTNNRKTELRWKNRQIDNQIPQWRFTERGLRRGL